MPQPRTLALAALLALPTIALAQTPRPITQDVYDRWRSIQRGGLSPDGRWYAYTLTPQVGDGEVVVRSTQGTTEYRVPRGFTGRPQLQPAADSNFTAPPPVFSADSRFVVFLAYATRADFDRARREHRKPNEQPKASLAIVSLADGRVTTVPRVRSFRLAKDDGRYVAYLLEAADSVARRDSAPSRPVGGTPVGAAAATPGGTARPVAGDSAGRGRDRREVLGTPLVVRELATGTELRIDDVTAYAVADSGGWLGYTIASAAPGRDGAYVRPLRGCAIASCAESTLLSGDGSYKLLAFDRAGTEAAFVSNRDEFGRKKARYALYHASLRAPAAKLIVSAAAAGDSMLVADRGTLEFTRDGSALVFGLAPMAPDSIPADSLSDKAVFDLWNYQDPRLQPQQRLEAGRDRERSYAAIYQVKTGRWVRLASDSMPRVSVADNGRVALGVTDVPYAVQSMWGDEGSDVYLIDASTGRKTVVARKVEFGASLSPRAKYVLYFDKGRWWSYDAATGKVADISGAAKGVHFDQETWDTPSTPAPWGVAGWTKDDASVLLYGRYDVWEADPKGVAAPRVVTDSSGTKNHVIFRVVDLDPDERWIDRSRPLLLRALDDETKASGFYRDQLGTTRAPERIVMADAAFTAPIKARHAEMYALQRSTFREFPDSWVGSSLDKLTRVTDANPEQSQYAWGSDELVHWMSDDGVPLKGLLFKPANFDSTKKYPMLVYYYEQLSENLHAYVPPAGRNIINPTVYTSLGYLVFEPDIAYRTGYPGPSALHSVVPGVQSLIARGFVDAKAVGLQGQSWGGYQTAYMITQTNMFRAAMAGAPVANMTSAYGGIRWESGVARAFQYEKTQSRIGGSLWAYPMRYIENSPLFFADRIETPLFIMSNDNDGAVPWYQGIEMFVALRRLGKEVYLIDYNGDGHNPRKRANQQDIDLRMQQFFGHHLKGEPAPDWMTRGIPFLNKGRDQLAPARAATAAETGAEAGPKN